MFLLSITGPSFELTREWFDTAHPALAPHTTAQPRRRGSRWTIIWPLRLGSGSNNDVVLPGLAKLHVQFEQLQPGEVTVQPMPAPVAAPVLDGMPVVDTTRFRPGSVLRLGPYELRLSRTEPLSDAERERLASLTRDDVAWRVFADEQAEAGNTTLAEWMRLERAQSSSRNELARLGKSLSISARAAVASGKILACDEKACPRSWTALRITTDARFRRCTACALDVAYCGDEPEGARLAPFRIPVVLDAGVEGPPPGRTWPMPAIG